MDFLNAIRLSGNGIIGRTTTGKYYQFNMDEEPFELNPETGLQSQYLSESDRLSFLMAQDFFPVRDWEIERRRYLRKPLKDRIATIIGSTGGIKPMMDFLSEKPNKPEDVLVMTIVSP